jgi:acyl-CoA reductase-like NAD-dependent aldehyde dehydrogenase
MTEIEVRALYEGQRIRTIEASGAEAVEAVLATAWGLFRDRDAWLPSAAIALVLRETARRMQEQAADLTREGGKPLVDSRVEVARAIDGVLHCAELLRSEAGKVVPMGLNGASTGRIAFTQHEPIGVVVAVSAFNHPLNLIVRQVAPAAGCPVIVKPATDTPLFCLRFFSILHEAGLPPGWCQALVIASRALSQQLVTDPRVGFFSFIVSAAVGWSLRSSLTPGMRCALEHGGAAPTLVLRRLRRYGWLQVAACSLLTL